MLASIFCFRIQLFVSPWHNPMFVFVLFTRALFLLQVIRIRFVYPGTKPGTGRLINGALYPPEWPTYFSATKAGWNHR